MGRHADAKRCYAEAVRHRPNAPAWSGLAAVAQEEGDAALALACYHEGKRTHGVCDFILLLSRMLNGFS